MTNFFIRTEKKLFLKEISRYQIRRCFFLLDIRKIELGRGLLDIKEIISSP